MKVLMYIVNYKSDEYLLDLIRSIQRSDDNCSKSEVIIYIQDNSAKNFNELDNLRQSINSFNINATLISDGNNSGYFGGLHIAQSITSKEIDCVMYCNADLTVDIDFFKNLVEISTTHTGIIAPSIISTANGLDQNPKYLNRLSLHKLNYLKFIYSNILTYCLFTVLSNIKESINQTGSKEAYGNNQYSKNMYAPHGAALVFTDVKFFKMLPNYPCFLFGEELFIAEEALKADVKIYYDPSLKIADVRHGSIRLLSYNSRRKLYHESVRFIIDKYFS